MTRYIEAFAGRFGVEPICRTLAVAPSSFYAARSRPPSARATADAELMLDIARVHRDQFGVYGARKLWRALRREGIEAGRDRVARLMGTLGLAGATRTKRVRTTFAAPLAQRPADLVERVTRLTRLVAIVGPAGVGKTRLAAEVAVQLRRRNPDGVWWIDLAGVPPSEVVSAIGRRLRIRDSAPRSLADLIIARLQGERALIVLDNCEHAGTELKMFVAGLLVGAAEVRVLATGREPLGLRAEQVYPLAPFEVPDPSLPSDLLLKSVAVRFLVSRARAAGAADRFDPEQAAALREVIERLDGLPLAGALVERRPHPAARG